MLDEDVDFAPDSDCFDVFADSQRLLPSNVLSRIATNIYNTFYEYELEKMTLSNVIEATACYS